MAIFTAIASAVSVVTAAIGLGAVTAAQVAWFAFTTAVTIGASALQRGIQRPTPERIASEGVRGTELSLQASPDHPRVLILGQRATAGTLVYRCTSGASNETLHQVIALADHEIEGLTGLWVEDQRVEWSAASNNDVETFNVPAYTAGGVDHLRITLYKGRSGQTHDAGLVTASGGQWTSNHVGVNIAYVVVRAIYNQDVFRTGGPPRILFDVKGAKLYDPRLDSTQAGGSGSHRFGQPATYAYSTNLEVARYNFLRGIGNGGDGKPMFGPGLDVDDVDTARAIAGMNVCDQTVNLRQGGTEPRYRISAVILANESFSDVLDKMSTACAGSYPELSGRYAIMPGAARSPALSLSDNDIALGSPLKRQTHQSIGRVPNELTGTWADPASKYERTPVPTRFSSSDETTDGGFRRSVKVDLEFVASQSQGQRVLEIHRRLARRQVEHVVTFTRRAIRVQAGDWISWTSDYYGYSTKLFRVEQVSITQAFEVICNLREIDAAVYDWDPATDELLVDAPADLPPGGPTLATVSGFALETAEVVSTDGTRTPAIRATWTAIPDPTVRSLLIEYRRVGDTPWQTYRTSRDQVTAGAATIVAGVIGGDTYEARARLETDPPRQVTIIAPVTAGNVTQPVVVNRAQLSTVTEDVRPGIITADDLIPSLRDSVEDETRSSNLLSELIVSRVRESTQGLSIARDIGALRRDVALGLAPISADLTRLDQVSADLQAQIAATATTAAANNATTAAAVVVEQGARTAGDAAEAAARTTAVAQLTTDLATVSSAVSAIAGPTGITAAKLDTLEVTAVDIASQSTLGAFVQAVERGKIDDELKQRVGFQNARIEENRVVGVINGDAIAAIDTRLTSETNTRTTQVATINSSLTTLTNADTALASRATALEAEVQGARQGQPDVAARLTAIDTARASGDSALSSRASALEATVNNGSTGVGAVNARLTTEEQARASGDNALASTLTNVSARADQATASGLVGLVAVATAGGAAASFRIQLRTTVGGTWRETGFRMDILNDNTTRIVFDADYMQFGVQRLLLQDASVASGATVQMVQIQAIDGANRFVLAPQFLVDSLALAPGAAGSKKAVRAQLNGGNQVNYSLAPAATNNVAMAAIDILTPGRSGRNAVVIVGYFLDMVHQMNIISSSATVDIDLEVYVSNYTGGIATGKTLIGSEPLWRDLATGSLITIRKNGVYSLTGVTFGRALVEVSLKVSRRAGSGNSTSITQRINQIEQFNTTVEVETTVQ
jgi:hypothetical protein